MVTALRAHVQVGVNILAENSLGTSLELDPHPLGDFDLLAVGFFYACLFFREPAHWRTSYYLVSLKKIIESEVAW